MMSGSEFQRFRLTVAYDGRPFAGWQSQAGGNTVQDVLLAALRGINPAIDTVQGSGRTDAGVSAAGQVAHFDAPARATMDAAAWGKALNSRLPPTIRVMACEAADPEFHARFDAIEKTYVYRIWTGPVLPPLEAGLAWHLSGFKGGAGFRGALASFEGIHDFRAFSANRGDGKDAGRDTVRTLSAVAVDVGEENNPVAVTLTGSGFLYKMVRFLVGSAVWTERGKLAIAEIERWLSGKGDPGVKAPFCAPADGLSLVNVRYST